MSDAIRIHEITLRELREQRAIVNDLVEENRQLRAQLDALKANLPLRAVA